MIINDELRAFLGVVRNQTITEAAEKLFITQAALSIKIKKIEDQLGIQLFLRSRTGLTLTQEGEKLLSYALQIEEMEDEWKKGQGINLKKGESHVLKGILRVGSFATIGRSLVLPSLSNFLIQHGDVELHFSIKEIRELLHYLEKSQVDFVFLDQPFSREGFVSEFLGHEEYVFITSQKIKKVPEIYLNHDEFDMMSFKYYETLGEPQIKLKRMFLDEIYSVIDGVADGIGVSIVPQHLVQDRKDIKIVNPSKKMKSPVYLCYQERSFRSSLFKNTLEILRSGVKKQLGK